MKLWHFRNAWDYHKIGGFVVLAESADSAAERLNDWLRREPDVYKGDDVGYWPGAYDKPAKRAATWTADDASEVTSGVFVASGCDD